RSRYPSFPEAALYLSTLSPTSNPFFTLTTPPAQPPPAHLRRSRRSRATSPPRCAIAIDVQAAPRAASRYSSPIATQASLPPVHQHRWDRESASREGPRCSARQPRHLH